MGANRVSELIVAVGAHTALLDHLAHNHFPRVHPSWIGPATRAIELANDGEWGKRIGSKSVREIIEGLHLEPFLEEVN